MNLKSKDDLFEDFTHNSQLQDKRANYWIKIELSQTLSSNQFWTCGKKFMSSFSIISCVCVILFSFILSFFTLYF